MVRVDAGYVKRKLEGRSPRFVLHVQRRRVRFFVRKMDGIGVAASEAGEHWRKCVASIADFRNVALSFGRNAGKKALGACIDERRHLDDVSDALGFQLMATGRVDTAVRPVTVLATGDMNPKATRL